MRVGKEKQDNGIEQEKWGQAKRGGRGVTMNRKVGRKRGGQQR